MLRTSSVWKILSLCLLAHVSAAQAQQAPSEAPPRLERAEEGSAAAVTIAPKRGATKITEKREGGRVTEVTVKSGKSTYTMKPHVPAGNAQPGDAQTGALRAPQWKVMEFDIGKKKQKQGEEQETAAAPPPPPAAAK